MPLLKIRDAVLRAALYPVFRKYLAMPGTTFTGKGRALLLEESVLAEELRRHVTALSAIGVRHHKDVGTLGQSEAYIIKAFRDLGFEPRVETFVFDGVSMSNIEVTILGTDLLDEFLVIGAHYDTVPHCPGADDNASGIAGVLALARWLKRKRLRRSIRLVCYANEEFNGGPWEAMGSFHHARGCKERGEKIVGMISLEMIGYFDDREGSQKYPFPFNLFYPTKGNFIAFVGNQASAPFLRTCIEEFRRHKLFPAEGVAAPERFRDIARSDHWSYWQHGWQAFMVTDTSNFRYPFVHTSEDTVDKLDFEAMSRIVSGIKLIADKIAG